MNSTRRFLISANSFPPAVGGYERIAFLIAFELASRGHLVKVITFTPSDDEANNPFQVYRNPGIGTLFELFRWSEIYIQNNVSFKLLWPLLFCWRPLVCVHHGFYVTSTNRWRHLFKHLVTLFSTNISVSHAVAASLPGKSHVVANPYRDDIFFRAPSIQKDCDLIFVGRIVSDKGIDVLIEALAKLRNRGLKRSLTIAGSGPEEAAIRCMVKELELEDLVAFAGGVTDVKLNELLNAHKIMIVPTREGEGFGVVALEGIACGCVVVGSTCGGLPEAIGQCGRTFQNGNSSELAEILHELLIHPETWKKFHGCAKVHLAAHRPSFVVDRYLQILSQLGSRNIKTLC